MLFNILFASPSIDNQIKFDFLYELLHEYFSISDKFDKLF